MDLFIIILMKKLCLILCLGMTACSLFQEKEERFVNPLFYETLYPISQTVRETWLTPTKIYSKSDIRDCQLLKNTERELMFSCEYDHPRGYRITDLFYKYVLSDDFYTENCQLVEEYSSRSLKELGHASYAAYCIHKEGF